MKLLEFASELSESHNMIAITFAKEFISFIEISDYRFLV
jgi:hypothetical protein